MRVCAIILLLIATGSAEKMRTWTDLSGKHKFQGEFVELFANEVILRDEAGESKAIFLFDLSRADRDVAVELAEIPEPLAELSDEESELVDQIRAAGGRVGLAGGIFISLEGEQFGDGIIDQIVRLKNVGQLTIYGTSVTPAKFASLAQLDGLRYLALRGKTINSEAVGNLQGLKDLEVLTLATAEEIGPGLAKLATLPKLTSLLLSTDFTAATGTGLSKLKRLKQLELYSKSPLGNAAFDHIGQLTNLRELNTGKVVGSNQIFSRIGQLTKLRSLDLRYSPPPTPDGAKLSGIGLGRLKPIPKLDALTLRGDGIDDSWMSPVTKMSAVTEISFALTDITSAGIGQLAKMPQLVALTLDSNSRIADLSVLEKLPNLEYFKTFRARPRDFPHIATLTKLRSLSMPFSNISDKEIAQISDLPELRWLVLSTTRVTGGALVHIAKFKKLRKLRLINTVLNDPDFSVLKNCPDLYSLDLSTNAIKDKHAKSLAGLQSLQILYLDRTEIGDAGIKEIEKLKNLRVLGLKKTKITADGIRSLTKALPNCRPG